MADQKPTATEEVLRGALNELRARKSRVQGVIDRAKAELKTVNQGVLALERALGIRGKPGRKAAE